MVAWFIPPEWLRATDSPPRTILEAAHFTAALAAREDHHIAHSNIPLIIHQTWKNTQVESWTESIAEGVEKWLTYATRGGNESMAYFLWLDEGCEGVVESEPSIRDMVEALPLKVEKSDVFRVLVLNLIGGVVSLPFFLLLLSSFFFLLSSFFFLLSSFFFLLSSFFFLWGNTAKWHNGNSTVLPPSLLFTPPLERSEPGGLGACPHKKDRRGAKDAPLALRGRLPSRPSFSPFPQASTNTTPVTVRRHRHAPPPRPRPPGAPPRPPPRDRPPHNPRLRPPLKPHAHLPLVGDRRR
jgi:hypothetical protein